MVSKLEPGNFRLDNYHFRTQGYFLSGPGIATLGKQRVKGTKGMSMVSQAPLLTPLQQTWMPFPWVHLDVVGQVENLERSWDYFRRRLGLPVGDDDGDDASGADGSSLEAQEWHGNATRNRRVAAALGAVNSNKLVKQPYVRPFMSQPRAANLTRRLCAFLHADYACMSALGIRYSYPDECVIGPGGETSTVEKDADVLEMLSAEVHRAVSASEAVSILFRPKPAPQESLKLPRKSTTVLVTEPGPVGLREPGYLSAGAILVLGLLGRRYFKHQAARKKNCDKNAN